MATAGQSPSQPQAPTADAVHGRGAPLDAIFNAKTVAVIGATERAGSVGTRALSGLLGSCFEGSIFAVHAQASTVLGLKTHPSIADVPGEVDLAVIATAPEQVLASIGECARAGVKGAVVMSRTLGPNAVTERQLAEALAGSRMRVLGPNSLGVLNPFTGLNATFGLATPVGGTVAFLSQSGAVCHTVLDWSLKEIVGFSALVSVGAMADVNWGDLIDHFGSDPHTRSIMIYMESIGDARSFLSAAREVALSKPIILIKAGRSDAAIAAVPGANTGCIADDDEVLEAACRRVGVLRVDNLAELFYMADVLSKQPLPKGPRLKVVSNAGGPGVLAADSVLGSGAQLALPSESASTAAGNETPGDLLGDGSPEAYVNAVQAAIADANCDGVLLAMVPQVMQDPEKTAELLITLEDTSKPLLACRMGSPETGEAQQTLTRACIPTFAFPHTAARAFDYMWRYSYNLKALYETPSRGEVTEDVLRSVCESTIHEARDSGRTELSDVECRRLLAAYRIPTLETRLARSEEEALRIAEDIGFPVVLRLVSQPAPQSLEFAAAPITLLDGEGVRRAWKRVAAAHADNPSAVVRLLPLANLDGYELALGSRPDPRFGPVLWFGAGGRMGEALSDRALGLPPLNATLARRLMEHTQIHTALSRGKRLRLADLASLETLLVRFSHLVAEQPWIQEMEINPLLLAPGHLLAASARVVLHPPQIARGNLPRLAIRPYPSTYVATWTMKGGEVVTIRPIRPEDEPLLIKFNERLSDNSVYLRFFQKVKLSQRTSHERLTRICFIDYDREMALVAERRDPQTDERQVIAIGNLTKLRGRNEGEVAVIISDDYQGQGLGTELIRRLVKVARDEKLSRAVATTMLENRQVSVILKKVGFKVWVDMDQEVIEAKLDL